MSLLTVHFAIVAISLFVGVTGIAIENGVTTSNVVCDTDKIIVSFGTENDFTGRIYVKGNVDNEICVSSWADGSKGATKEPTFEFDFGVCNMERSRTLSPTRGMMQSIVVVISFHSLFITKVDKAYKVQCFYMEAEKAVTASLEVSMLTTDSLRDTAAMPQCTYTVRRGGPDGEVVRYAQIGEPVYHEWVCPSDSHDILVKECYVDDGAGNTFEMLDDRGCSIDKVVMADLTYDSGGVARAFVEAHVFKFADRPNVYFKCVLQLCNRGEPECLAITPPNCASRRRLARNVIGLANSTHILVDSLHNSINEMDISSQPMKVMDIEDALIDEPEEGTNWNRRDQFLVQELVNRYTTENGRQAGDMNVCMSPASFGTLLSLVILVFFVAMSVAALMCLGRIRPLLPRGKA